MKYLMLIYGNQEKWASMPAEAWPEAIARQDAFNRKYAETGELIGAYGLADAAVHDEAATMAGADWPQILALYELLELCALNPFTTLNRAVAMVRGPGAGLQLLADLAADRRMARHHRLLATRAHLQELAGDTEAAAAGYLEAARRTTSLPERRHLALQAARLRTI